MLRRSVCFLSTLSSSSTAASSSTTGAAAASRTALLAQFERWLQQDCTATYRDNVRLDLDATYSRGLVAKKPFRQGTTVVSIPMSKAAITAEHLLQSQFVQASAPPTFTDVRKILMTLSFWIR